MYTQYFELEEKKERLFGRLYNGYRVFLGGKERPGREADHSPPSSAVVKKE